MRKTENECVACGLPCLGSSCKYSKVTRYYCDYCKEEATLYHYNDDEVCVDCILANLEVVEGSDI